MQQHRMELIKVFTRDNCYTLKWLMTFRYNIGVELVWASFKPAVNTAGPVFRKRAAQFWSRTPKNTRCGKHAICQKVVSASIKPVS